MNGVFIKSFFTCSLRGSNIILCLYIDQVSEDSCRAQFLVPVTAQGQNRAQASLERAQNLNPMVEVHADADKIEDKPDDFFLQFDAVSDNKKTVKTVNWLTVR